MTNFELNSFYCSATHIGNYIFMVVRLGRDECNSTISQKSFEIVFLHIQNQCKNSIRYFKDFFGIIEYTFNLSKFFVISSLFEIIKMKINSYHFSFLTNDLPTNKVLIQEIDKPFLLKLVNSIVIVNCVIIVTPCITIFAYIISIQS